MTRHTCAPGSPASLEWLGVDVWMRPAEMMRLYEDPEFLEHGMPVPQRWNVDVVAYGPSLHDENSYCLMRRFDCLADRDQSEISFYGSEEWRQGRREAIRACIENYTEIVLELDDLTVQGLRQMRDQ